jgi:hypothetical protein
MLPHIAISGLGMVVCKCNSNKAEVGRSKSKAGLGKSCRSYLKNKLQVKGLGAWLKWDSICLTSMKL